MTPSTFQLYIEFSFEKFEVDPDEITKKLRVTPSKVSRRGQTHPVGKINRWIIRSTENLKASENIETHWDAIRDRCASVSANLSPDDEFGEVRLFIVVRSAHDKFRDLVLPKSLLEFAHSVDADICVEINV